MSEAFTSQRLILIAAVARGGVIGADNQLPWHISEDLRYFKSVTLGKSVISGRRNFEAMGRALPKRRNIILTRQTDYEADGCEVVHSLEEALRAVEGEPEVFVIGGGEIYRLFLERADALYLTEIDADFSGDVTFPTIDERWLFDERAEFQVWHQSRDGIPFRFTRYTRR
jgi:dihydrofolate reductase